MKIFFTAFLFLFIFSCTEISQKKNNSDVSSRDSAKGKSCAKPIKDPNHPKPMALMMRLMASNADSMKSFLLQNRKIDSLSFPFIQFYLFEPTDSSVLEPLFYKNAGLFKSAYTELMIHPKEQKKYFDLMVGKCINCHESYCHGPLKRIKKLLD